MKGEKNVQKSHNESRKSSTSGVNEPPQNSEEFEKEGGWCATGYPLSNGGNLWPNP